MYTISIDEYGNFESQNTDGQLLVLGGMVYDDCEFPDDFLNEKKRIESYYRNVIEKAGVDEEYPTPLHASNDWARNHNVVSKVKQEISRTLPEFIKYGTYYGRQVLSEEKKRQGKYYIFANLKSDRAMDPILGDNANILASDDYAGNLYFHMSTQVINRLVFHNPVIQIKENAEFLFNLATRTTPDMSLHGAQMQEFYNNGYQRINTNDAKVLFRVSTSDIYRTAIAQEMIRVGKQSIKIKEFVTRPIIYHKSEENLEFLYLADSICSYLTFNMDLDNRLEEINVRINRLNCAECNLLFAYDAVDVSYQKAYGFYESGNYYDSLSTAFDSITHRTGQQEYNEFDNYYAEKWFKNLVDMIKGEKSEKRYSDAVKKLYGQILTNHLDYEKNKYIFDILKGMVPSVLELYDEEDSREIFYLLFDAGVSLNCHVGNSIEAERCYKECEKYCSKISLNRLLQTRSRLAVAMMDQLRFEDAKKIITDNIKIQNEINKICVIPNMQSGSSLALAKSYSQLGQINSFLDDKSAEEYFVRALGMLENNSADYKITQSYLLHFYIDDAAEEKYLKESKDYFGGKVNLDDQFSYILDNSFSQTPIINFLFALYVFVKGVYVFRYNDITSELRQKLYSIDEIVKEKTQEYRKNQNNRRLELYGHPSELIYKYIEFIALRNKDFGVCDLFAEKRKQCISDYGPTIRLIIEMIDMEKAELLNDRTLRDKCFDSVKKCIKENFFNITNENPPSYDNVRKMLGYMFR